jgi:hypothetical protein
MLSLTAAMSPVYPGCVSTLLIYIKLIYKAIYFINLFAFCFLCLQPHGQFFSYLTAVTIIGDRAANVDLCVALIRATSTATRDLGLNGLIRKTETHVPQWDSNPWRDHQSATRATYL